MSVLFRCYVLCFKVLLGKVIENEVEERETEHSGSSLIVIVYILF